MTAILILLSFIIPSKSEWNCDIETKQCICDSGTCHMDGQQHYIEYICTNAAKSCIINCEDEYSCLNANFYMMSSQKSLMLCNGEYSCFNSHIYCGNDMDLCHIKINHNGMINGYIKCDDNISNCNVEIISKQNQIAMDNTIFECNNHIGCQLNGCNDNQCIKSQFNCMDKSCLCTGNDCNSNINMNIIDQSKEENNNKNRHLLTLNTTTSITPTRRSGDFSIPDFTIIEYIVIAISLMFCCGTCGIFMVICYCQRLKTQALKRFRAAQSIKRSQRIMQHNQDSDNTHSDDTIVNLKCGDSPDSTQQQQQQQQQQQHDGDNDYDITSTTKHKKHHENHEHELVEQRSHSRSKNKNKNNKHQHRDYHKKRSSRDYHKKHKKLRDHHRNTNALHVDLPNSLYKRNALSSMQNIDDIPPPPPPSVTIGPGSSDPDKIPQNPVEVPMHTTPNKAYFPQLITADNNRFISNSYDSHHRNNPIQSKTHQFNLAASYNEYNKPQHGNNSVLGLNHEPFPTFTDIKRAKSMEPNPTTTVSAVDKNGVQHHHHIYYVNAMQHVIQTGSANNIHHPYQDISDELPSVANRPHAVSVSYLPNVPNVPHLSNIPNRSNQSNVSNVTAPVAYHPNIPNRSNQSNVTNVPNVPNVPHLSNIPNRSNQSNVSNVTAPVAYHPNNLQYATTRSNAVSIPYVQSHPIPNYQHQQQPQSKQELAVTAQQQVTFSPIVANDGHNNQQTLQLPSIDAKSSQNRHSLQLPDINVHKGCKGSLSSLITASSLTSVTSTNVNTDIDESAITATSVGPTASGTSDASSASSSSSSSSDDSTSSSSNSDTDSSKTSRFSCDDHHHCNHNTKGNEGKKIKDKQNKTPNNHNNNDNEDNDNDTEQSETTMGTTTVGNSSPTKNDDIKTKGNILKKDNITIKQKDNIKLPSMAGSDETNDIRDEPEISQDTQNPEFSLSETPVPGSYVPSLPENMRKQKKPYKY